MLLIANFVVVYFLSRTVCVLLSLIQYNTAGLDLLYMDYELSYAVIAHLDTFYPFFVFSQARNLFLCGPSLS